MNFVMDGASDRAIVEQRHFVLALAVSVLFHAYVLFCIHHPSQFRSAMGSQPAMEVSFRGAPHAVVATDVQPEEPNTRMATVEVVQPVRQVKPNVSLASTRAKTNRSPAAAPAIHPQRRLARSEASLIIVIDEDGRPGSLTWNALPALTQEQFDRLERHVRQRKYPNVRAGTAIDETIDVFTLTRPVDAQ